MVLFNSTLLIVFDVHVEGQIQNDFLGVRFDHIIVHILRVRTERPEQTVKTQITRRRTWRLFEVYTVY